MKPSAAGPSPKPNPAVSEKPPYPGPPGRDGSPSRPSPPPPTRKSLPHGIPSWVEDGAVYFITVNCVTRELNQLALPGVAAAVEGSLRHYQSTGKWWIHLFLLMPDHLHALISFSREAPIQRTVSDWKRFLARKEGIEWQRDFFDHRLRNADSQTEKWHYIRANPVRKGLVKTPEEWPYQWTSVGLAETAVSEKPPYPNSLGNADVSADGRDGSPSRPSASPPRLSSPIAAPSGPNSNPRSPAS